MENPTLLSETRKRGPAYRPIFGNTVEYRGLIKEAHSKSMGFNHEIERRVIPEYHKWSSIYGKTFLYWYGWTPRLAVADPEMIKEILLNTSGSFEKISYNPHGFTNVTCKCLKSGQLCLPFRAWPRLLLPVKEFSFPIWATLAAFPLPRCA
ncbi:hypothetical protein NE237_017094 [Protea cynaroides]|uniref:Uncharacterized protein n=1 Tax=Protea cynaroides TaxID=273540 RepID=A0A9Q0QME9_9MAGN|nr:hypothetical protein NE237_017094 [Protea cynaroides]